MQEKMTLEELEQLEEARDIEREEIISLIYGMEPQCHCCFRKTGGDHEPGCETLEGFDFDELVRMIRARKELTQPKRT